MRHSGSDQEDLEGTLESPLESSFELPRATATPSQVNVIARVLMDLLYALDMSVTNAERLTRLKAIATYYGDDLKKASGR